MSSQHARLPQAGQNGHNATLTQSEEQPYRWLSVSGAAKFLGLSKHIVREAMASNELSCICIGTGTHLRTTTEWCREYINRLKVVREAKSNTAPSARSSKTEDREEHQRLQRASQHLERLTKPRKPNAI